MLEEVLLYVLQVKSWWGEGQRMVGEKECVYHRCNIACINITVSINVSPVPIAKTKIKKEKNQGRKEVS